MKKFITFLLGAVAVILVGLCFFVVYKIDKTPPVISVINPDLIYMEGSDQSVLIKAVQAIDKKDGDVSDTLRVESTYVYEDKSNIKVTFVAKDTKNNIKRFETAFAFVADPNKVEQPKEKLYNIALINNLGVENLANTYAKILQTKGHKIAGIGLSTDPSDNETAIYVKNEGDGTELLEVFPNAKIYVGNIENRLNIPVPDADVFVILGWQHSVLPEA